MLNTIFATKGGMSQVWTKQGKRLPVTKCMVDDNVVLGQQKSTVIDYHNNTRKQQPCLIFEIGYGKKKLKNTPKPLREKIKKSGFSFGVKQIKGVHYLLQDKEDEQDLKIEPGTTLDLFKTLEVGDIVKVQGTSKGRGFAGVIKRHGMHGGNRTHGQSDRERAPGSIGAMTDPGRVLKGKKMPGHYGVETKTVANLTVVHLDPEKKEVWLSGPIPGYRGSTVRIVKTGQKKELELDQQASGIEIKDNQKEKQDKEQQEPKNKKNQKKDK
jgi:large subunit ribosomal protein L3